ncbi:major facilitator superfamily domain-containing protein [Halteromyces radiatus]|uniref:major facilitator superfamily domain-containing protein n=1 Tax=Halteromyces radiatus TaxID=101107 RepID=UPI002220A15C|nr:major facilitator superfamily domain-containing protein [Halteromyces radiatus]KAI8081644.1 major facilitator superfamily domain-containing protein [Halteromyces radiatus]
MKTPTPGNASPLLPKKPPVRRPSYHRRSSSFEASIYNGTTAQGMRYIKSSPEHLEPLPGLSTIQLVCLSLCMAGVQFTWTVELSYGTPYLLSLHLSRELTASVWLAGPLSGLIVHPIIGAFSDKSTSRFGKRRPFIVASGILTCLSMLGVAYAKEIGLYLAGKFHSDDRICIILVAVASFYFLDFTLNAAQAICRALILDIPPLWQQDEANAWSARMSNSAMVMGYLVGSLDLVKHMSWLGNSQMKVFCLLSILVFCTTLAVTCFSTTEKKNDRTNQDINLRWHHTFLYIWKALRQLPTPIQTLCNTQFFAWMGWFPFLFYSTQWVSELYFAAQTHHGQKIPGNWAEGSRMGSFALLCYSIVSVVAGFLIPLISNNLSSFECVSLTNIYTTSHLISATCLLSTWFIRSVTGAVIILSIMGISWAVVLWVPFCLVGEYVSYVDDIRHGEQEQQQQEIYYGSSSSSSERLLEQQDSDEEFDAGLILGVHNMYIVFPQFAVAVISAFIFAASDSLDEEQNETNPSSVAMVLTFGGLMALVAAGLSRYIVRVK